MAHQYLKGEKARRRKDYIISQFDLGKPIDTIAGELDLSYRWVSKIIKSSRRLKQYIFPGEEAKRRKDHILSQINDLGKSVDTVARELGLSAVRVRTIIRGDGLGPQRRLDALGRAKLSAAIFKELINTPGAACNAPALWLFKPYEDCCAALWHGGFRFVVRGGLRHGEWHVEVVKQDPEGSDNVEAARRDAIGAFKVLVDQAVSRDKAA